MDSHFDEVVFIYQREAIFHCFDTIQWLKLLALGNQGVYWAIYLVFVHLRQEFESRWMFIKRKSIWTVCIINQYYEYCDRRWSCYEGDLELTEQ